MNEQIILWLAFVLIAVLLVGLVVLIKRFWEGQVNKSDEDVAWDRRVSSLNEAQANRRRDDEIVRLLSGDEQRTVGDDERE